MMWRRNPAHLVIRCATDCVCALPANLLGKPEIRQLEVAILVHQQVLRLEISVHNAALVQVIQGQQDICCKEERSLLIEGALQIQVVEQLTAYHQTKHNASDASHCMSRRLSKLWALAEVILAFKSEPESNA